MTRRLVLDTSALMTGRGFDGELFTTEEVLRELRRQEALTPQLEAFLDVKVRLGSPSKGAVAQVESSAEETGDAHRLSRTDVRLLALARELGATIVTDDYSIQNLAADLGVPYEAVAEEAITERVRWRYLCRGCGARHETWSEACPTCGAALRTARDSSRRV